jgi:hypothetical protein
MSMNGPVWAVAVLALTACAASALAIWYRIQLRHLAREHFIRSYVFPSTLFESFQKQHATLSDKDVQLVARALRQYFIVYLRAGHGVIGMPSRVVDDLWHEFILATRTYQLFCQSAFGHFLHHIPAAEASHDPRVDASLALTWKLACLEENIKPSGPTRLPLLFAIDEKLSIPDGYKYSLNTLIAWGQGKSANLGNCSGAGCASTCGSGDSGGGDVGGGHGCGGGCAGGGH